jgi:hypothetical protein
MSKNPSHHALKLTEVAVLKCPSRHPVKLREQRPQNGHFAGFCRNLIKSAQDGHFARAIALECLYIFA